MKVLIIVVVIVVVLALLGLAMAVRIVKQYEQGVLFRFGRVQGPRDPGLRLIIPFADVLHRVSLRIVTMPIQSQGIITRDNVSVDVSAVAYFRVVDAVKSVVAIENVNSAIDQIAQTTLRKVVGQHTLDQTLSETDKINLDIRKILDVSTVEWGVEVTLVELKDIQLPDSMKRAMARQAEAEREKRAKIINAEGESLAAAALGDASDTMMAHPLALQLRNLQSLVEIGVDKNTTVVFPAPLMTTIAELGAFLAREQAAASRRPRSRPSRRHAPPRSRSPSRRQRTRPERGRRAQRSRPDDGRASPACPLQEPPGLRPLRRTLPHQGEPHETQNLRHPAGHRRPVPRGHPGRRRRPADLGPHLHRQRSPHPARRPADLLPRREQPGRRRPGVRGHAPVRRPAADHRRPGRGLRRPLHRQPPQGHRRRQDLLPAVRRSDRPARPTPRWPPRSRRCSRARPCAACC